MELLEHPATKRVTVTSANIEKYLGVRKILPDRLPEEDPVGLVNGLAWTSVGGEVLEVECNVMDGSGKLELTGNLGQVMQESVRAAMSYIRSRAKSLGVEEDFYKTKDIGGLKEKTMAALRHGVKTVIIPQDNAKDLEEIDQTVRKALNFVTVRSADTVLETALRFPQREEVIQAQSEAAA